MHIIKRMIQGFIACKFFGSQEILEDQPRFPQLVINSYERRRMREVLSMRPSPNWKPRFSPIAAKFESDSHCSMDGQISSSSADSLNALEIHLEMHSSCCCKKLTHITAELAQMPAYFENREKVLSKRVALVIFEDISGRRYLHAPTTKGVC